MKSEQRAIVLRLIAFLDGTTSDFYQTEKAIALLRELAAEPQGEPVIAIVTTSHDYGATIDWTLNPLPTGTELYAYPPQRQPLTEGDINAMIRELGFGALTASLVVRATERKHDIGEKK